MSLSSLDYPSRRLTFFPFLSWLLWASCDERVVVVEIVLGKVLERVRSQRYVVPWGVVPGVVG